MTDEIVRSKIVKYEIVNGYIVSNDIVSDEKVPVDMRVLVVEIGILQDNVTQLQEQLQNAYIRIKELREKLDRCIIIEKDIAVDPLLENDNEK